MSWPLCGFCRHEVPWCTCAKMGSAAQELAERDQAERDACNRAWADYDAETTSGMDARADRAMEQKRARAEESEQNRRDHERGD